MVAAKEMIVAENDPFLVKKRQVGVEPRSSSSNWEVTSSDQQLVIVSKPGSSTAGLSRDRRRRSDIWGYDDVESDGVSL